MKRLRHLLLATLSGLLLAGCGSSFVPELDQPPPAPEPEATNIFPLRSATGGEFQHPDSPHGVSIPPASVGSDGFIRLELSNATELELRNPRDFSTVGQALDVTLHGTRLVNSMAFVLPYDTGRPEEHRLYWHLPGRIAIPLPTDHDPDRGLFTGVVDLSSPTVQQAMEFSAQQTGDQFTISVVDESGWFSRPAHQDWSSYNLYVFQEGAFVKVVDQGQDIGPIPTPGDNPLMIVHGLGSNIPRFNDAAKFLEDSGQFSAIYGFEYDTLSSFATSAPRLFQAYEMAGGGAQDSWHHLAHSMGCLISRTAFESGSTRNYASNRVVFAAGPHLGSEAINVLQGDLDTFQTFARYLVVNEVMDFTNADGRPCQVSISDAGFTDLAVGSMALNALNQGASGNHPAEEYRTLGGNDPGLEYDAADYILGVSLSDGLVNLPSANPDSLIGSLEQAVVPESHSSIVEDTVNSLPVILNFLTGNDT